MINYELRCINDEQPLSKYTFFVLFFHSAIGQNDFYNRLADSAMTLTKQQVQYDPAYIRITYPNGDIPANKGVCTDVVIRAYRKLGIDLQKEVHEDLKTNFAKYPKKWGLTHPDKNIDHRRVPNLMTFFSRYGTVKTVTQNPKDYCAGDIVCWDLGYGITHIGIVSSQKSEDGKQNLIVHNIGGGQVLEDCLFDYTIIGHYQYPILNQEKDLIQLNIFPNVQKSDILYSEIKNDSSKSQEDHIVGFYDDTELFVYFAGAVDGLSGDRLLFKFIRENLKYPDSARKKNIEGTVYVSFSIDKYGKISDTKITKSVSLDLDNEVLRVISIMPNWEWDPKIDFNRRKTTQRTLPIVFKLK